MKFKRYGYYLIFVVLLLAITPAPGFARQNVQDRSAPQPGSPQTPLTDIQTYLPLVKRSLLTPPSIGSEMYGGQDQRVMSKALGANIHFTRVAGLSWKAIEPTRTDPPTYSWDSVDETSIKAMTANGINVIAMVRMTPDWAQKYPGVSCGPVAESALDAFAQFMTAAVNRYSKSPYSIHYWEIGNEPDIDHTYYNPNSDFGCWGEAGDEYFGGGYYATMLEKVYPAIKTADPSATVIIGGLLLDCDPTNPPAGKDCLPSKFLEGILRNNGKIDGGEYFDMVSFHGYPPYNGTLQMDEHYPSWETRGGVVLGKVNFIREVLANYGITKPIFHSEGSLICPEYDSHCNPAGSDFFEAQADYVVWLYVRNIAANVKITAWFQFIDGWRYDGLIDQNFQAKPSHNALKFLTNEIGSSSFNQQITTYTPLRTYEFLGPSKKIWVVWSPDEAAHTFTLPSGTLRVVNKYGVVITPVNNQISIKSPVYIEITR